MRFSRKPKKPLRTGTAVKDVKDRIGLLIIMLKLHCYVPRLCGLKMSREPSKIFKVVKKEP